MRRWMIVGLVMVMVMGCSKPDPKTNQLLPDQKVVVSSSSSTVQGPNGEVFPTDSEVGKFPVLYREDEAIVVKDPGFDSINPSSNEYRYVTIVTTNTRISHMSNIKCRARRKDLRVIE